jgi:hypothetical protein
MQLSFQTLKMPNVAFSTIRNIPIENSKRSVLSFEKWKNLGGLL